MDSPYLPDKLEEFLKFDDGLQELAPYLSGFLKAYKYIQKKRFKNFFKTLNEKVKEWDSTKKKKFEKFILTDYGQELLSEYIDAVLLTSSKVANASLAILYADQDDEQYSKNFKNLACISLKGCSDQLVEFFVTLMKENIKFINDGPYAVKIVHGKDKDNFPELFRVFGNNENCFLYRNDLVNRRMILPDHTSMRMGDENDWSCDFGIYSMSNIYLLLFEEALNLLKKE